MELGEILEMFQFLWDNSKITLANKIPRNMEELYRI